MSSNDYSIVISDSDNNGRFVVNMSGNLTIDNSNSIHNYLIRRALTPDNITINIKQSDNIDLSIIQLIIGFINTRNNSTKETIVNFNIDESMLELLNKSGATSLISSLQKNI